MADLQGRGAEAPECVAPIGYEPPAPASGGPGRGRLVAVAAAVLVVALAVVAGVAARYVAVQDREAEMVAAGFHMSSDTLKGAAAGDPPSYTVPCDSDGTFSVNLYNWEVSNADSVSGVAIGYEVEVTGGVLRSVTSGGAEVAEEGGSRTLAAGGPGDSGPKVAHVLHVEPDGTAESVVVTVKATVPYEKTLRASYSASALPASASVAAGVTQSGLTVSTGESGTGAAVVTVRTGRFAGELVLSWREGLTPAKGVVDGPGGWSVDYGARTARVVAARSLETYRFEFVGDAPSGVVVAEASGTATVTVT